MLAWNVAVLRVPTRLVADRFFFTRLQCPHSCPPADQHPSTPAAGPRSTNSEEHPQRPTTVFQPKEPRPLLVTSGSIPVLESHGSLWTALDCHSATHWGSVAMDLCGQLWMVTQPHTGALWPWGRRPPLDTRNPGS